MGALGLAVAIGTACYLLVTGLRIGLAAAIAARPGPAAAPADVAGTPVTVLQAIRSGDPLLAGQLAENLANNPRARFLWLVDEDDPQGREVTGELAAGQPAGLVQVLLAPPLPPATNPKVFKLALALPECGELVAVLDDDTVLPAGALDLACRELSLGDLVTGIPVYRPGGGPYGRLVAAFVNGSALITYLPVLRFASPVTINGMFYLTRRSVLESLGGFERIADRLCDDYELAKLYRAAGRPIVQSAIVHPLATTVPSLTSYLRLMRRWMLFAQQLFREELPLTAIGLVILPSLLPLALLILAAVSARPALLGVVLAAMALKATAMALLRRRAAGGTEAQPGSLGIVAGVLLEMAADLLVPLNTATALIKPGTVRWRDRVIQVRDGAVAR
jgi:ceramide glucosyltransferase